jgi:hypothetical protein
MSDSNELKPNTPAGTPVPDLIEQYRVRRDAWIAQADELARLRDEVRGSAEREAMEIVTAARRDVRQIVMEARRELLVLSAQVQAALGEASTRPDSTGLLGRAGDTDGGLEKPDFADAIFSHQDAVKGMLDEARADMDALDEDARTVPFQALAEPPKLPPPPELPSVFSEDTLVVEPNTLVAPNTITTVPPHGPASSLTPPTSHASASSHTSSMSSTSPLHPPAMSTTAPRTLLSSPFPSDAVPVPSSRRARMFVGLFGVAGIAVLVGTIVWMRSDKKPATTESAAQSTAPASASSKPGPVSTAATTPTTPSPAPAPLPTPVANTPTKPSALSLLVEARRSSWLRTTVDGESDSGRMLAQGETVRLNAKQSVLLRVGDAGAVFVSVNSGQAAPLGRDGQVVTRQFVVESKDRQIQNAGGSSAPPPPAPSIPQAATTQTQKPVTLPTPIAAAPPNAPAPSAPPPSAPNPVPLVQPVAATPPRPIPTPIEPGPSPAARAETTVPPAATPRPELPTSGSASPASAVVAASRQWLDAYHRQDRATMATLQTDRLQVTDERRTEERFPSTVTVNRTLDRVSVQIAADTAVLTAVMTERSSDNAVPPRISPISQVWEFRGNQWRVSQVRLTSEARLNQIFR